MHYNLVIFKIKIHPRQVIGVNFRLQCKVLKFKNKVGRIKVVLKSYVFATKVHNFLKSVPSVKK